MEEPEAGLVAHLVAFADRKEMSRPAAHLMLAAADTITRLANENERLRAEVVEYRHWLGRYQSALSWIADQDPQIVDDAKARFELGDD